MAHKSEFVPMIIRHPLTITPSTSYFDGRHIMYDDANTLLLDVGGTESGTGYCGVVMRLAFIDVDNHIRIYIGENATTRYVMTCNTTSPNRVTFDLEQKPI